MSFVAVPAGLLAVALLWATEARAHLAQSFTAPTGPNTQLLGVSGDFVRNAGGATASIFAFTPSTGESGTLTGSSLFTQFFPVSGPTTTLTPNITLVGGATYALVLTGPLAGAAITTSNPVPGGAALSCTGTNCSAFVGAGGDVVGFTATYGPVSSVPEPSTYALPGTGLLAMGGIAARRRRAHA